ncbi:LamG-like jellyroll fold domain-containing protein [Actinosynnema sp. NPDC050801]|uniref:LamG-like jellyroll fold domain-containing protein n=1 Tax=unclassified Actinosynnema TaxID=2637065 RepID=UPI0033F82C7A
MVDSSAELHTPAESTALTEAQRTGQPVAVVDEYTETSEVLANPDGTFTMRTHVQPVRVKRDGAWRDVDSTLTRTSDGGLAPVASPVGVTFSGGGTAPLVTMRDGDKQFALNWPSPLPAPVVDGSTATYPGVFPGVDLQLTASAAGYSEVLVVRDAQAAANPDLSTVELTATTTGLDVRSDGHDVLSAVDAEGRVVFQGSTPIMWDSSSDAKVGPAPTATDPGSGRVSKLDVTAETVATDPASRSSTVDLTVTPDAAALTGGDVEYPVYIDPVMSRYHDAWAEVTSNGWYYWNANMDAQVGFCDNWAGCNGSWTARSFFRFTSTDLQQRNGTKAQVFAAYLYATQVHGTSCSVEYPVAVYQVDPISSATRWPGPNGFALDTRSSKAGVGCDSAGAVRFDVYGTAVGAVDNNWSEVNFGLRSPDETNRMQWKKFANNPHLDVVFAFPPNVPHSLAVGNAVTCDNRIVTPDAYPMLYASASDNNNPPLNIGLFYEIWNSTGTTLKASMNSPVVIASGSQGSWNSTVNLGNGDWAYRVAAWNQFPGDSSLNRGASGYSSWLWFTTRAVPIGQRPTITSTDYPADYWGRPQNQPGRFTFNASGAPHIAGFTYTFSGAGTERVPTTTDCDYNQTFGTTGGWVANNGGTARITVPPTLSPGYHTLHVRSFDDAHKLSPESEAYTFYVAPSYVAPAPTTRIEAESLTPTGSGVTTTVVNDAAASGGKYRAATTTTDGATLTVPFTAPTAGYYNVDAGLIDNAAVPDAAVFTLDGKLVANAFQGGTGASTTTLDKQLAGVHLTAGAHQLDIKIVKKTGSTATAFKVGLDYLELSPTVKLDAEAMPLISSDKPLVHMGDCCGGLVFNSGAQMRFEGDDVGQELSLEVTVPIEADYAVGAGITKAFHYGNYSVSIDDTVIGQTDTTPVDGYDPGAVTRYTGLGGTHLTAGKHTITFRTISTHPDSTQLRYRIALDYLTFQPVNNVTAVDFTAAMNNKGIGNDGTTAADVNFIGNGLSAQTLTAAGLAPGRTAVVGGAPFTMPLPNPTTGNDNIVAVGQTIPFPTAHQVKASAVGLLAVSTCGGSPARHGTITYTDGTTSNPQFPSVNSWIDLPWDPTGITLPHRLTGPNPDKTLQPVIYPIFAPADPTKTVKSLTLPNYGSSLLPNTCAPALHVLSIAPRPVHTGWVGAWAAPSDAAVVPPGGHGFADKTLRTVLRPTVTGGQTRVTLSNALATTPVTIDAAAIAAQIGTDSATGPSTPLRFAGATTVTLPAGGEALSDPVAFPTSGNGNLVVSIHLPTATTQAPMHGHPTAPTYLAPGNTVANTTGTPFTTTLPGSHYITGVDVSTTDPGAGTVVVLGDQLSATAPPGSTQRDTWVDELPATLAANGTTLPGGLINASRAGIPDTARWRLTDGTGTTARDSTGNAHATAHGGVTWSTDHNGSAVLNGTGHFQTAEKVLDTTKNLSVSTWIKITSHDTDHTAVSQDGNTTSALQLHYSTTAQRWSFTTRSADSANPTTWQVLSKNKPALNTWTYLTATYDAHSHMARLYVDGALQTSTANVAPFAANGPLALGRARHANNDTAHLHGSIADVRVQQWTITQNDIVFAYNQRDFGTYPDTGAIGAGNARTDLHRTALNAPNTRTVLIATGANSLLRGATATDVRTGLTALTSVNSPEGLKRHPRPDGTPIHVILTTVPPLGLDANDPREAQRRQLNQDIMANFHVYEADYAVDFDEAVRDPSNPNRIAPQYLTNGVPNEAYHHKIAQHLADAINTFPPRAEL